jgi:hypothetical protein
MFKTEQIQQMRDQDVKRLERIKAKADQIAANKMAEIEDIRKKKEAKIEEKNDKKDAILRGPISKQEVLELCREALRENRRKFFFNLLVQHVKAVQIRKSDPMSDRDFRVYVFHPDDIWKIAYAVITEKDLEEAVKELPDIGLTSIEKETQVKVLDSEIAALEDQIEKELKNV